jgi:Ser/Thr protein kinase RdoA (MazF antagonist)
MNVPRSVLDAYALDEASLVPVTVGLVNQTFFAATLGRERVVLQRLHPVFLGPVNEDIDAITRHLASKGMPTPRLVRTPDGAPFVTDEGVYRVLTYVEGRTLTEITSPEIAASAGALVARVHAALADLEHVFAFTRPSAHDTRKHLARLEELSRESTDGESRRIADAILEHASALPEMPVTRTRIVHGDLKITNVLFHRDSDEAVALVDLDTFAHGTIPVEMGDAFRSWCNPRGESDVTAAVSVPVFEAAVSGYLAGIALDADERDALVLGTETIATELAARFCVDAFEDRYFGYDASRYPSRVAHNRVRARSQLSLSRSVRDARAELERAVRESG